MFKNLCMLEGGKIAIIITNADETKQRVHGVEEVCLFFCDRDKAK